jgi:hypothetical protein
VILLAALAVQAAIAAWARRGRKVRPAHEVDAAAIVT